MNVEKTKEISDFDQYLFHEGTHMEAYKFMGAHLKVENEIEGVRFTTWAPKASAIHVVGDFNNWKIDSNYLLYKINNEGLWSAFIPNLTSGLRYKLAITNADKTNTVYKADPYSFKGELRPFNSSVLDHIPNFLWEDSDWLEKRAITDPFTSPMNIYELHLASWKTKAGKFMTFEELSNILPSYIKEMGYTHVEFMPITEHPLDMSWGYQATGYFAPTARHGDSIGLKILINKLHKLNIGVILDWVPGHFCKDEHGLHMFDGTPTYEYLASWKANNEGWGTINFDLGKPEVKSFLFSSACYWLKEYHFDGLRVDAVSNILYLNFGRESNQWEPNFRGDNANIEGIEFFKEFNKRIHSYFKGVITIAEESTAYPKVTSLTSEDSLGFTFKWNMGWMNDTLSYIKIPPASRKYYHFKMNFPMFYNYSERFILPISHDEVVHEKGSLIEKMWGDTYNKFAGLKLYAAFMMGHPGKKLMFMGSEFAQPHEWREYEQLNWAIIQEEEMNKKTHNYFKSLNNFYLQNKALWELDYSKKGFKWIDADNAYHSIYTFIRYSKDIEDTLIYICNFTPTVYEDFKMGVPYLGKYIEVFNTDSLEFGGLGHTQEGAIYSVENKLNNLSYSICIKVPPMSISVLKYIV